MIVTPLGNIGGPQRSPVMEENPEDESEEDVRPSPVSITHFNVNNSNNNNEEYTQTRTHTSYVSHIRLWSCDLMWFHYVHFIFFEAREEESKKGEKRVSIFSTANQWSRCITPHQLMLSCFHQEKRKEREEKKERAEGAGECERKREREREGKGKREGEKRRVSGEQCKLPSVFYVFSHLS